ncbi:MAG: hypothetical protein O6761_08745 [Thaumarchaeota archaeon]|nr:hypothetical protein [Nitrososphaerota archaeon]
MADIGAEAELVNAQNLKLDVGSDRYVMLQELDLHIGRPEAREPTTDGGVIYFYGKGDHYFDATILLTTPEITTFNALTELNANGNLTSTTFKIVAEPRGGGTDNVITVVAVLPDFNVIKPVEGGVLFRVRFRITGDTVTVAPP